MHDCFGRAITMGCRVRAATKEELEGQGHPEKEYPTTLSPVEQFALPASCQSDTCNVKCVPEFSARFAGQVPGGTALELFVSGAETLCTARTLVRID
jgi:hypothetical protein